MTLDNLVTVWATTILGVVVLGGVSVWLLGIAVESIFRHGRKV